MSDTGTADGAADTSGEAPPAAAAGAETAPPPSTDWEAEAKRLKAVNRKVEDQNKANLKRLAALEEQSLSDQEKAVRAAVQAAQDETRTEVLKQVGYRLVDAEVRTAAAGSGVDVDALLEGLDRSRFLGDDLEPDTTAIATWVQRVTPKRDSTGFDIGQGARGNGGGDTGLTGSAFERDLIAKVGGIRKR